MSTNIPVLKKPLPTFQDDVSDIPYLEKKILKFMSYNGYLCSSHNLVICHSTFLIWHNLYALLKMKIITKTLKESYEEEATIMEKKISKIFVNFFTF